MVKPEWGAKHGCPKCGTRFYDMGKDDPVTCVECKLYLDARACAQVQAARSPMKKFRRRRSRPCPTSIWPTRIWISTRIPIRRTMMWTLAATTISACPARRRRRRKADPFRSRECGAIWRCTPPGTSAVFSRWRATTLLPACRASHKGPAPRRHAAGMRMPPAALHMTRILWGLSSAGRAPAWHAGGQRFDPARLHHFPIY